MEAVKFLNFPVARIAETEKNEQSRTIDIAEKLFIGNYRKRRFMRTAFAVLIIDPGRMNLF